MNHFIEYVCRGVVRSEDAIRNLSGKVVSLVKCNRNLAGSVICLGVAGLLLTAVVAEQDKEIKALKKQVSDLAKCEEASTEHAKVDVANNVEEQTQQEGA